MPRAVALATRSPSRPSSYVAHGSDLDSARAERDRRRTDGPILSVAPEHRSSVEFAALASPPGRTALPTAGRRSADREAGPDTSTIGAPSVGVRKRSANPPP